MDLSGLDLVNDAANAIDLVRSAIGEITNLRFGAQQNRLEHTLGGLRMAGENLKASESRIRDLDLAAEMVTMTRHQIMAQAGTAMLAQANQAPRQLLSLISG
ncbi:MAG: flagellin [Acidimicrobiales bacterium]